MKRVGDRSFVARIVAIVAAVLGILLTLAVPFLSITQTEASLSWPQGDRTTSVDAPLVSYAPVRFDASIPCAFARDNAGILVSTAPAGSSDAKQYGLVAESVDGALRVTLRDTVLLETSELSGDCSLTISSDHNRTTATFADRVAAVEGDVRPQLVGVYSDIDDVVPEGLRIDALVDTRFSSTPATVKFIAMILGVALTLVSLVALHVLDNVDGRRSRRFLPRRWWTLRLVDGVVVGALALWHIIGANTSDDGYQFGMARTAETAGYMANYFRYFGVPESPFGTPLYDVFTLFSQVSTASIWMRVPALLAGVLAWFVISREIVPRLGQAARTNTIHLWTGGLVFLAFWLPYNNGLRPEPFVALGVLLTWCSVERAIATRRLLPAAVAVLIAAFTVTCGPSGVICFAPLIAGIRPIVSILVVRSREASNRVIGVLSGGLPIIAAGTVILVAAFADQTVAGMREMQVVHAAAGPTQSWFEEHLRYQWLLNLTVADGSLSRRFGVFVMILAVVFVIIAMLRKGGRIPGTAQGPSRRIIGVTVGAMALMSLTPTKWTHHFGVFAGLAAVVCVLASVAAGVSVLRSRRNRWLLISAVSFLLAIVFTGKNGYWYASAWGVPWWDKPVMLAGFGMSTYFLGLSVLAFFAAAWFHVRAPYRRSPDVRRSIPVLTVAAAFMVVFEILSMAKGALSQYPSYSLAKSNVMALSGSPCGLANGVLLEEDSNASMLGLVDDDAFESDNSVGFSSGGVAVDLTADREGSTKGAANSVDSPDDARPAKAETASSALPFGLDPASTPVLGTFGFGGSASLTTGWYSLPVARGELLAIAAAGRIESTDSDGIVTSGQKLEVEYGSGGRALGRIAPIDIGPSPSWRNLRVPMSEIPDDADSVRIVAADNSLDRDQWLAVTPPRMPLTRTLNEVVGTVDPVLLDWEVGFNFPCQRPFDHRLGIAEIPEYRILPDSPGAVITTLWQDHFGGGPLGWIDMSVSARTIPSYLSHDLDLDWGSIERYTRFDSGAVPAEITTAETRRAGLWTPGPIKTG